MGSEVVVTLRAEGFSCDFELPANICLKELYPRLLKVLKKMDAKSFRDYSGIVLEIEGAGMLEQTATLLDYGVKSGYYLDIVRKEKYDDFR